LLIPLAAGPLYAQEAEPEEPEIILPRVILEIEDLSVETISAGIPEDALIPSELEIPLPDPEDLTIDEPAIMLSPPKADSPLLTREQGKYLNFEGVIGVGSRNNFMSGFSLYQFEREPEGRLLMEHEVYDGLSGFPEGNGYNLRSDSVEGGIGFHTGKLGIGLEGLFDDHERGLQGLGDYYSKIARYGYGLGSLSYPFGERFSLSFDVGADVTAQLLTASGSGAPDPDKTNEYLFKTSLDGRYTFNGGLVGLEPSYSYRDGADGAYQLSRVRVKGYFGVDLGEVTRLEGDVSWFWSDTAEHLFPFTLTLSTYPTDLFSVNLSAGYKLLEYNLSYLFLYYPFADAPQNLYDDYGWFFNLGSHIHIARAWVANVGLKYMRASNMLTTNRTTGTVTGLFPVTQVEADRLATELGMRWNQSKRFSAYASWLYDILDRPSFFPQHSLNLELSWIGGSGKYGADLTGIQKFGVNDFNQAPIVNVSGYYRVADFIRLVGEVNDILYPALDEPRYDWYPFVDVGLQFAFKVYINF
jgi:hypothetical protein